MVTMVIDQLGYWVVIPAAGTGRRMQSKTPKQYIKINGQMIIEQTLSIFTKHPLIQKVIVVLHADGTEWSAINAQHPEKIATTVGGERRADSVMQGLQYLQPHAATNDWVLVHDAARPFLSADVLDRFIESVADHPVGGLLAMPVTDTVKKVDADHGVCETIPREGLWAAQTPQMFRYGLLFDAMEQALKSNTPITDESGAIELIGERPLVVEGDKRNIKITTQSDLERAVLCE